MNRFVFIDNFIAPFAIFPGDVFCLKGTNVYCEIVYIEGNLVTYFMRHGKDEHVCVTRSEFDTRFDFAYEGELPRIQRSYYGDNDEDFSYEHDWFDSDCYKASDYQDGYEF